MSIQVGMPMSCAIEKSFEWNSGFKVCFFATLFSIKNHDDTKHFYTRFRVVFELLPGKHRLLCTNIFNKVAYGARLRYVRLSIVCRPIFFSGFANKNSWNSCCYGHSGHKRNATELYACKLLGICRNHFR